MTDNERGDNIFTDFDPPEAGTFGQMVDWWHEGGQSTLLNLSVGGWLNEIAEGVRAGKYEIRRTG